MKETNEDLSKVAEKKAKDDSKEESKPPNRPAEMKSIIALVDEAVRLKEARLMYRALRGLVQLRPHLTTSIVTLAVEMAFGPESEKRQALVARLPQQADAMDVEEPPTPASPCKSKRTSELEVQVFVQILVAMFFLDQKQPDEALTLTTDLVDMLENLNAPQRSLDPLAARVYFYFARCHELLGSYAGIRKRLLVAHRTASLKHNEIGQATLHNLLMRNYMASNLL